MQKKIKFKKKKKKMKILIEEENNFKPFFKYLLTIIYSLCYNYVVLID